MRIELHRKIVFDSVYITYKVPKSSPTEFNEN